MNSKKLKFNKMSFDLSTLEFNEIVKRISQDKELFLFLSNQLNFDMEEKFNVQDIYKIAYGVFLGSYYHKGDEKSVHLAMDFIQFYANAYNNFNVYNSMMIQAYYYLQPAPGKRTQLFLHHNKVGNFVDLKWKPLNPFMTKSYRPDTFLVGLRMTNFEKEVTDQGVRYFSQCGRIKNYYELQECKLKDLYVEEKINRIEDPKVYKFRDKMQYEKFKTDWYGVDGYEDYRVASSQFQEGNAYVAFAVTSDAHKEGCPRLSMIKFRVEKDAMELIGLEPLRNAEGETIINNKECQKNWLPFFVEDENSPYYKDLLAIYNSNPLQIIKVNQNGECSLILQKEFPQAYSFRGSSPPLWINGKYIYSVHIVGYHFNQNGKNIRRVYYHRLIELDREFNVLRISRMFYLNEKNTIEYISGSYHDEENKSVIFSFGFNDKEAWLATLTYEEVESLFAS